MVRETPLLRDLFAMNIAGVLLNKSDIKIDPDQYYTGKMDYHNNVRLSTVAWMSYQLADKLMEQRIKKD